LAELEADIKRALMNLQNSLAVWYPLEWPFRSHLRIQTQYKRNGVFLRKTRTIGYLLEGQWRQIRVLIGLIWLRWDRNSSVQSDRGWRNMEGIDPGVDSDWEYLGNDVSGIHSWLENKTRIAFNITISFIWDTPSSRIILWASGIADWEGGGVKWTSSIHGCGYRILLIRNGNQYRRMIWNHQKKPNFENGVNDCGSKNHIVAVGMQFSSIRAAG
jgi:hypothetical protein